MVHPGPTGRYLEAAFSPNGRLLTTFSGKDSNVWVWDLVTRKCITMLAVRFGEREWAGAEAGVGCQEEGCRRDSLNTEAVGWVDGGEK